MQGKSATCAVNEIYEVMNDEDKKALIKLIESNIANLKVSQILANYGHSVSYTTIRKHRRGYCKCGGL